MIYLAICLLVTRILAEAEQPSTITLIHDDSIDLQHPRESMEQWIQVIVENMKSYGQTSRSVKIIHVDAKTHLNDELVTDDYKTTKPFIIITKCETVMDLVHGIKILFDDPNIIFLDFFVCQPIQRSEAFHLELFRLKIETRPACVQFALNKWIEDTIYFSQQDKATKRLLNLTFSTDAVFNECNQHYNSIRSSGIYLTTSEDEEDYVHRFLNGKKLYVSTLEERPLVTFIPSPVNSSIGIFRGICFDIFNIFQQHFNFTYDVLVPNDGSYGVELKNGTWNGVIGMVVNKVADIGIHSLSVTHQRYQVLDFIPFDVDPKDILVPKVIEGSFACAQPFLSEVWMLLSFVLLLFPLLMWICERIFQLIHYDFHVTTLTAFYFYVYRTLLYQNNGQKLSRSAVTCLLMMTWSSCAIVISNAYTGKIISNLLAPHQSSSVNSLEELTASSLSWIIRRGTSLESRFLGAEETDKVNWKIGERFRQSPELMIKSGPDRFLQIREHVASGKFAYIGAISSIERVMEEDYAESKLCRMRMVKDKIFHSNKAFVISKGNPLANIFNKKMLQVLESGLGDYWKRRNYPEFSVKNICKDIQSSKGEAKLTIQRLKSAFQILALGLGLATGVFFLEIVHHYRQKKKLRT